MCLFTIFAEILFCQVKNLIQKLFFVVSKQNNIFRLFWPPSALENFSTVPLEKTLPWYTYSYPTLTLKPVPTYE